MIEFVPTLISGIGHTAVRHKRKGGIEAPALKPLTAESEAGRVDVELPYDVLHICSHQIELIP